MTGEKKRRSGRRPMLTDEQREAARQRWETSPARGFAWLSREVEDTFGVQISRAALQEWARRYGWAKKDSGDSEPLPSDMASEPSCAAAAAQPLVSLAKELDGYFDRPAADEQGRPVLPTLERFAVSRGLTVRELRARGARSAVLGRSVVLATERQRALLIEGAAAGIFSAELAAKVLQAQGRAVA